MLRRPVGWSVSQTLQVCTSEWLFVSTYTFLGLQGTIARLSARLESSIANEGTLKQRLQHLEAHFGHQQSHAKAALPAHDLGRQSHGEQPMTVEAATGASTPLLLGVAAQQQEVQLDNHTQPGLTRQASQTSQQQQQQQQSPEDRPSAGAHAERSRPSANVTGSDIQQGTISRLGRELQAAKATLARDQAELEELRRHDLNAS